MPSGSLMPERDAYMEPWSDRCVDISRNSLRYVSTASRCTSRGEGMPCGSSRGAAWQATGGMTTLVVSLSGVPSHASSLTSEARLFSEDLRA